jgi:sigma54-dependent transcription regulator
MALADIASTAARTLALQITQRSLIAKSSRQTQQQRRLRNGLRRDLRRGLALRGFRCDLFLGLQQRLIFTFTLKYLLACDSDFHPDRACIGSRSTDRT